MDLKRTPLLVKFHKVITKKDHSLTILSAAESGICFGRDQPYSSSITGYLKSVSVFAESIVLSDHEAVAFESTAETVTLSTGSLVTQSKSAIVSACGQDGKPNIAGGSNNRDQTHGKPGRTLNVFVGDMACKPPEVNFKARGGNGATTGELDHAAGNGGQGGTVRVLVRSTWTPIIDGLRDVIRVVRQSEETSPPNEVYGFAMGINRLICRLCQADDPLAQQCLDILNPLCEPDAKHTRDDILDGLAQVLKKASDAQNTLGIWLRDSTDASGGHGGAAERRGVQRGISGADGKPGVAESTLLRDLSVAGPLDFVPLHPLQCQMQLDKGATLFYFGDETSLAVAQAVLSRLVVKMRGVLDFEEDKSATVQSLSEKQKEARNKRLDALRSIYHAQRDVLGIPRAMTDPVDVLCRIAREASDLLFRLTRTSVDFYGHQKNWAPRLAVNQFKTESEKAVEALEKVEGVYLDLARQSSNAETANDLRQRAIKQATQSIAEIFEEQKDLENRLFNLRQQIQSPVVKIELHRRAREAGTQLDKFQKATQANFEIKTKTIMEALGNVAKDVKVADLFKKKKEEKEKKPSEEKDKGDKNKGDKNKGDKNKGDKNKGDKNKGDKNKGDKDKGDKDKGDKDTRKGPTKGTTKDDDEDSGDGLLGNLLSNALGVAGGAAVKSATEAVTLIWDGATKIPSSDGKTIDKSLIVSQIQSVIGDLTKVAKEQNALVTVDPETGEATVNEKQSTLLVTSKEQIDKFVENFVGASKLGPQAKKVQEAFQTYIDLLADRNHDKVQYNLILKKYLELGGKISALKKGVGEVQKESFKEEDLGQLSQFTQLTEEIFASNRARAMHLISLYRRAIYIATLERPSTNEAGGHSNDIALTLPAMKLTEMQRQLSSTLFHLIGKAGSDASPYPPDFRHDRGKYVDLTQEQLVTLRDHGQVRVTFPAPSRTSKPTNLREFHGSADVRVHRVRFWLEGIKVKPTGDDLAYVPVGLRHEGDSVYYDRFDQPHAFAHDPIELTVSYRIVAKTGEVKPLDSGDILSGENAVPIYAAPSPFATWTISLEYLNRDALDLSGVTKGQFEFFGTSRGFHL